MIESGSAIDAPPPALSAPNRLAGRWRRDMLFFFIAALVVLFDQFTKWLVRSNLDLYESWDASQRTILGIEFQIIHVTNSGAAFGILQGQTPFLIITSLVGLGAILLYYVYPPMDHGLIRVALGMQLGGAVGNLLDRVRNGEVVDFVDVGEFPTFNVADSAISVSIVAVLLFFALQEFEQSKQQPPAGAAPPDHGDG